MPVAVSLGGCVCFGVGGAGRTLLLPPAGERYNPRRDFLTVIESARRLWRQVFGLPVCSVTDWRQRCIQPGRPRRAILFGFLPSEDLGRIRPWDTSYCSAILSLTM